MASGDQVVTVLEVWPPTTLFAVLARRVGGSTPAEGQNVWQFDTTTIWYLDFLCALQGYDGGGLTFTIPWTAATATTGTVIWGISIHRLAAGVDDVDASHDYASNFNDSSAITAPGTAGMMSYTPVTFINGADMDGWLDGELAVVRVRRNTADSMAGFAELWTILGKET
jgi:hypothetical protein